MKTLTPCEKPSGELTPIDSPLNVRGKLYQTYRLEIGNGDCEYYEQCLTDGRWMKMVDE